MGPENILDSLGEGVYVTDVNRRIVYWNKSAEAITGWTARDIVGKCCYDDILCRVDKDGHRLCREEYCPLHRAIVTAQGSNVPIVVFAKTKDGRRVPVHVNVAPVRNAAGQVVGGVEVFRDLSDEFHDFERARKIQIAALGQALPQDDRVKFASRYVPRDIVGGDCYRLAQLDQDRYGFFLADVSGHGVAAALFTMFLLSLWETNKDLLTVPRQFAESMNRKLCEFVTGEAFSTAICGMLDLTRWRLTLACAGGPQPLLFRDACSESLGGPGLPWGLAETATYDEVQVDMQKGDRVLVLTDGAIEIQTSKDGQIETEGLIEALHKTGYPGAELDFKALEQELLSRSSRIRLDDDVTFLEIRMM